MAEVPISDLVAATLPLAGDELVPIVQSNVTKNTPSRYLGGGRPDVLYATQAVTAANVNAISSAAVLVAQGTEPSWAEIDGDGKLQMNEVGVYCGYVECRISDYTTSASLRIDGSSGFDFVGPQTDLLATYPAVIIANAQSFTMAVTFIFRVVEDAGDLNPFVNECVIGDAMLASAQWNNITLAGTPQARWSLFLFKNH